MKNVRFCRRGLPAAVLAAVLLLALSGIAYARYGVGVSSELNFQTTSAASFTITGSDGGEVVWTPDEDGSLSASFRLSSSQAAAAEVCVLVMCADSEGINAVISDGKTEYSGKPLDIPAGSALYSEFGAGTIYRFYDEDGAQLSWSAPASLTVTLTGCGDALVELAVVEAPANYSLTADYDSTSSGEE